MGYDVVLSQQRRGGALPPRREPAAYLTRGLRELVVGDDREHLLGVDSCNVSIPVLRVDDDVAGEQNAELGLGLQRAVRELRVAGAEDQIRVAVDVELLLQRCLHVDLAQHAESLARELLPDPGDRICEAERGGRAQGVADINVGHASSNSLRFAVAALARWSGAPAGSV